MTVVLHSTLPATRLAAVRPIVLMVLAQVFAATLLFTGLAVIASPAEAQETVCARVKIEIKQELTLERQAFEAEMKINNTTDTGVIENVSVVVKVTDENGTPVAITDNPNELTAKFFVRQSGKQNISDVNGTGTVSPKTTSVITWLLIPAPGAAGSSPLGKKYLVGATLKYRYGGEDTVLEVSPDVITVKPLPLLTLDYFLTQNVWADDPLTAAIEPVEPFTLGVRVKNNGYAAAKNLKIDSAQPKIIENSQGLLINFVLTGSYLDDAPAQKTLLINFGDIAAGTSKMGRWIMETTLAGKFTEFTARFSHADELGGALTSLLQATNAHFLIRDVRVDLPGRDFVRDFLGQDGDVIRVYESDGPDTEVTDRSGVAVLTVGSSSATASYRLSFPATAGFVYIKLPDPFGGAKALGPVVRSDAKQMLAENVWLSKTRNEQTKQWEHWINFFDVNTTGVYDSEFQAPVAAARPPVVQFVPDRTLKETKQVSFVVEASSPDGKAISLVAAPLPAGARFTQQAADPAAPGVTRAIFDWTPAKGAAGSYLVNYTASDGALSAARSAGIRVDADAPAGGPGTPAITAPLANAHVSSLKPLLSVQTSILADDPTTKVQFELYADEAQTQLVASALVDRAAVAAPTTWAPPADLNDNTRYWWRARASDGTLFSAWVNSPFFVNLYNDAPDAFNLTSPAANSEVASLTPMLTWTNSVDRDGDAITYSVGVYKDAALTDLVAQAVNLPASPSGTTSWVVGTPPLTNRVKYYWRVVARDALGAQTPTPVRAFTVNLGNAAPSAPALLSPAVGSQVASSSAVLTVQNSTDADGDLITLVFEIDTVNTFDSGVKRSSGQVMQSAGQQTVWSVAALVENQRYFWRVKAQDGLAESAWVAGNFLLNAVNEPPPTPTVRNPGNGAWTSTQQPSLEASAVLDPEGETVRYQFEVYRGSPSIEGLANRVADGTSATTAWLVNAMLADKATHWWRVRALDALDAASPWSPAALLYVSTGAYQDPVIQVTAPATSVTPAVNAANRKVVTIRWDGTDPNIDGTVALYHATSKSAFSGTLIVDGLRQPAGAQSGSYEWDVTELAPGTYYVYAAIYDARAIGRSWAAGAVVVAPAVSAGQIIVSTAGPLKTTEDGGQAQFTVKLASQPSATVVVPVSSSNAREGYTTPASLTFTPATWNVDQGVVVTGRQDCMRDGNPSYQALVGKAVTTDPQYIDVSGTPVVVSNTESIRALQYGTNNPSFAVCAMTIKTAQKIDAITYEYTVEAVIGNTGTAVGSVSAKLTQSLAGVTIVQPELKFGALQQNEAGRSVNTLTLRSKGPLNQSIFNSGANARWTITVH